MSSRYSFATATIKTHNLPFIALFGLAAMASISAGAAETATLALEFQAIDLDSGTVVEFSPEGISAPNGADIVLLYNADTSPHAAAFPATEGVEIALLPNTPFEAVTEADIPILSFSNDPEDLPLSVDDTVVIRTDQGSFFKIGNAVESDSSSTFNYERLQ